MRNERVGDQPDDCNWLELVHQIVGCNAHSSIEGVRRCRKKKRVPVGWSSADRRGSQLSSGAGSRLDYYRLTPDLAQMLRHNSGEDIRARAHNDLDGTIRINLCCCGIDATNRNK